MVFFFDRQLVSYLHFHLASIVLGRKMRKCIVFAIQTTCRETDPILCTLDSICQEGFLKASEFIYCINMLHGSLLRS